MKTANKKATAHSAITFLAGETRFEHATYGFGDRYSTVEPLPFTYLRGANITLNSSLFSLHFSLFSLKE